MSSVLQPTGLRLVGNLGSSPYAGGTTQYPLTTNNTVAMAVGDVVGLVGGSIVAVTATPTTTMGVTSPVGVCLGFEYTDPINPGRAFVCSQILAANAITNLGYLNVNVLVADNPLLRFLVQADGTIAATAIGKTIALTNFSAVDLVNRTSRVRANAGTLGTTSTLALKIVGFDKCTDNAPADAFTRLICKWNFGVHLYDMATAQ